MTDAILVVENDRINQEIFRRLLRIANHNCDIVSSGAQALRAVQEKEYALILMNLRIPNINGFDASATLRRMGCTVPIVGVAASAQENDGQKALDAGINGYLSKPFLKADFDDVLNRWVDKDAC